MACVFHPALAHRCRNGIFNRNTACVIIFSMTFKRSKGLSVAKDFREGCRRKPTYKNINANFCIRETVYRPSLWFRNIVHQFYQGFSYYYPELINNFCGILSYGTRSYFIWLRKNENALPYVMVMIHDTVENSFTIVSIKILDQLQEFLTFLKTTLGTGKLHNHTGTFDLNLYQN
ncbi:hypothetical protein BDC45DRAFT_540402 [Circinella umbellata]|nr:hypothetical protein BDC45DRAFT_540402 [Circinella umbellata]